MLLFPFIAADPAELPMVRSAIRTDCAAPFTRRAASPRMKMSLSREDWAAVGVLAISLAVPAALAMID